MSKEAAQVEAVEALLDQTMKASSFGFGEEFTTIPVGQVRAALAAAAEDWERDRREVRGLEDAKAAAALPEQGICPECEAGKHSNCLGEALTADDEISGCRCEAGGHDD